MAGRTALRPNFVAHILKAFIVTTALFAHSSCYLLNQGASLIRYQAAAEPIDSILEHGVYANGTAVSQQTREFLAEVGRIREYSQTQGLAASRNYVSLVPTQRQYLADVVNAAGELSFERHEWWWPFVGRLPYKGYYDPPDAARLAGRLEARGLDVWIRPVDAFSTLGMLRDPLFEFMTDYDRYTIANLIIHEQAHATLFLKGHAQFNEEFATFVGDVGAEGYLRAAGASPEEINQAGERSADRYKATQLVLELRDDLEVIYQSDSGDDEKRVSKAGAIQAWQERIATEYESMFQTDSFRALSEIPVNNAYIDLYVSYTEDLSLFGELFESVGGTLAGFIEALSILREPAAIPNRDLRRLARRDPKSFIRIHLLDSTDHR